MRFNVKTLSWVLAGLVVALGGAAGWLWYQNGQLQTTVSDQAGQISTLRSDVALLSASPTPTPSPSPTPVSKGTITGSVAYPAGQAPAQSVCAAKTTDAKAINCVDQGGSASGSLVYSLPVDPGTYYVYASLKAPQGDFKTTYKAYYNQYVACQAAGNCAPGLHNKYVPVTVAVGQTVKDINPTDWYALGVGQ